MLLLMQSVPPEMLPLVLFAFLLALTLGMTVHEFAHNYAAHLMGDPVPARQGKLTLNPLVHIYWPGWLMWAIIGFGILGLAYVDPLRLPRDNRRWRWLAVVAAGPVSNLLLAILFGLGFRLIAGNMPPEVLYVFLIIVSLNVSLCLFNFLPFFPIDGWQIVYSLLPPDMARQWDAYKMYSQYAFFGLLLLSFVNPAFNILGLLVSRPSTAITSFLLGF